ncbi:integrin alpha-D isoform X2 [Cololabis saira]|uniref:integrin alpha-D isoform X2 n=1 Tax=Cololabis saira TaxID=129043 RepID=UPI002AD2E4E4|nr:integrin alpha-D isoform X2 [Cololabis saira]
MYGPPHISLFTCMVAAAAVLAVSVAFNIDFTNPEIYDGKQEDFFGYKVLQFSSAKKKGVIVTSPLQLNGSGGICKYENSDPKCFRPDPLKTNATVVKYFGLSIAAAPSDTRFTVCSPSVAHECHKNTYLNSFCYNVSDELEQLSFFKPLFQDCTKKTVDLVFLFDGSGSMTGSEFHQNKEFIKNIMSSLKNTSIKFAAVQFSSSHRKVFDFNEYKAGHALLLLNKEPHMEELTNTHSALTFVLNKLFMNAAAGASPDATKVLVLITDGDPSDRDRSQIIKQYESKKIIRFVIGVKVKNMEKFKVIASEPKDKNVFKIEEYDGLKGILDNFQKRIFNVEGSTLTRAGNLTNEMSQSGFSAAYNKDTLVLGSVGSNSWGGALQEQRGQKEEQISDPEMHEDSYMGFSISVGERNGVSLYFSGAPRFEHKGQVVLFSRNAKNWTVIQRINDGQIGSYFGAELCSVDVDSDGSTDFLLVGAPLFFQPQEKREGRVYIYTLTDSLQLERGLSVTAPSMGRFGTTISSLADLNGDGLGDVAVGAPMEDDNRGSVYIYLGDRYGGIRSTYSQRVMGEKFRPNMRFFGQAIDGHIDLGDDGLPDIVVGSQGAAVVLRSRPVFNVSARLSFQPQEISTEKIDCLGSSSENLPMVNLTLCFEMEEATKSKGGAASSGLNITYTLSIDPMRQTHRGLFSRTDRKAKNLTSTHNLINKETCFTYSTYMPKCVKDTLSPINIRLTFSQPDSENARASLNTDSRRHALVEVPFQKHCKKNDTCIAELEVDFSFISSTLVVKENNYFNVSISLNNHGDDSYNTSLTMFYPPGLSFSRMILSKASRPTLHGCNDLEGVSNQTVCGVSLPVYRSRSFVTFTSSFHILHKSEWNDTMTMTVTGQSDNLNSSIPIPSMTKSIPVQFEVNMASAVTEGSVTYLNFTLDDPAPKNMSTAFRIDNTGFKDFPVSVSLVFPIKLEHGLEVNDYQVLVQPNETQCSSRPAQKSENCSAERCVHVECNTFNLRSYTAVEFWLVSKVQFKGLKERAGRIGFFQRYTGESREVRMKSYIKVDFDKQKYVLGSHKKEKEDPKKEAADLRKYSDPTIKSSEARVEYIFPPQKWLIVLTGTVLGFLLLLIIIIIMFKLGCFKRKTLEEFEEEFEEEHASHEGAPASGAAAKSEMDEESDEPTEEEAFMDTKTNGSF